MTKPAEIEVEKPDHPEMPEAAEHKMPFAVLEAVQEQKPVEETVGFAEMRVPAQTDEEIADAKKRDAALDRITAALASIGIDEADLELALGIEPASVRKAKMPKREKLKSPAGLAQKAR